MFVDYIRTALTQPINIIPAIIVLIVIFKIRAWSKDDGIPSVKSNIPVVGNLLDYAKDMEKYVRESGKKYGQVFQINLLLTNTIWLNSPALNKEYLFAREDVWSFGDGMGVFLNKVVVPNFFDQLRVLVGSLSRGISNNAAITHYTNLAGIETEKAIADWADRKEPLNLFKDTSYIVHKIIVQCMMGPDFYDAADELFDLLHVMEANLGSIWNFILPEWLPYPAAKKLWAARDRTKEIFNVRLAAREKEPEKWKKELDYISYTLRDPVTAHLKDKYSALHTVLMFAAHTSTVAGVAWTIIELLRNPQYLERLRKELAANPNPEESEFMGALMKETVRHYVAFNDLRFTRQPKTLTNADSKKPITIPAGTMVSISPYITHHDPSIWANPNEYLPERWIDEPNLQKKMNEGNNIRYLPFGAGSHRCPGEKMALMMMRTIVAKIVMTCDMDWPAGQANQNTTDLDFAKIGSPWLKGDIRVKIQPKMK
ncbi:hypothetical protein MGYG_00353 [Nannizzia gypsea CBS 118893]|uniref:Cytochrome P450 n=1 Tax=Arthroderma gypseum (strain ATCC MYA-4604 / CBS 118893) TaxID=535722 RepID=E5QZ80_ARTGP|nr:hypothetical protein MGYG_00353 [Nannizzia gypsea CBS 118893]EFQ97312.1 hypothetical protein MGYG_00353 [Nannizzia gypsea CBS 118893]